MVVPIDLSDRQHRTARLVPRRGEWEARSGTAPSSSSEAGEPVIPHGMGRADADPSLLHFLPGVGLILVHQNLVGLFERWPFGAQVCEGGGGGAC
jgi:hypothetical protein